MLRLSKTQTSSIELTLKDMTSTPLIGLLLNATFDIVNPDFSSIYDKEDTSIFLRLHYFDKSLSDIKCIHTVVDDTVQLKLTSDNSLVYLNFDKLINNMTIRCETLLLNINLFEKYAVQEFLIKQPKLNLLDFVALTANTKQDNSEWNSELQKVKFNNQQICERLDKILDDKISDFQTTIETRVHDFKMEMINSHKSHTNIIEQILDENEQHKKELSDSLADKVDNFELVEIIGKLKKQISDLSAEVESKKNNDDEITAIMASFEKIQQSLLAKNNCEIKEEVTELLNKRLADDINLTTLEGMKNFISSKNYFHIGKIDVITEKTSEKSSDKKKYAWIKVLTNIDFPKLAHYADDKPRKPFILDNQNILLELFQLQVKGTKVLPFVSGVYLPKGPKSPLDFPIGHKKYEWLEAELHLQFDITDLPEPKVDFLYQNFVIADTIICNYDNIDWRHYYINNFNSYLPKKKEPDTTAPTQSLF